MIKRYLKPATIVSLCLALLSVLGLAVVSASGDDMATYRVSIVNLSHSQPLSPPVAATHKGRMSLFSAGKKASPKLELLAEDGNQVPLAELLRGSPEVGAVVDVGAPLTPWQHVVGSFTDTVSFEISARPGDRLSLASMLICSNDGFVGLNGARLPWRVQRVYALHALDAGTENNTEMSADLPDPCSALGLVALAGDPNGNEDAMVNTQPQQRILPHRGTRGVGDLSVQDHGWAGPIGVVIVQRID